MKVIINSKSFPDQNPNDLTVYFDEYFRNVKSMELIYVGIPQTFYNISEEFDNNKFVIGANRDSNRIQLLTIPDGFYDFKSFTREFSNQLHGLTNLTRHSIRFDVQEPTGKVIIHFQKRGNSLPFIQLSYRNDELLGIDRGDIRQFKIPRSTNNNTVIGDKPINFKPFEYFQIHCDIVNTADNFFNGKGTDLLASVPIKDSDFGEINHYKGFKERSCESSFSKLRLWITNEKDKLLDLNDGDVQYEISFTLNE